jgi:hypothetical protein
MSPFETAQAASTKPTAISTYGSGCLFQIKDCPTHFMICSGPPNLELPMHRLTFPSYRTWGIGWVLKDLGISDVQTIPWLLSALTNCI